MRKIGVLCVSACVWVVLCFAGPATGSLGGYPSSPRHPLEQAARDGDLERVKSLLAEEENEYVRDYALRFAIQGRHREVADFLISRGARNALVVAAAEGDVSLAGDLLTKGSTANERDSALHATAWGGHREATELLLSAGANVNATRFGDYTPLFVAAAAGCDLDTIQRFTNFPLSPWSADMTERKRSPANPEAFRDVVELLIQHGADINAREKQHGFTPLHYAVFGGSKEVVGVLLDHGVQANPLIPPDAAAGRYVSPLHLAAHYGDLAICKLLVARGADVNSKLPTENSLWIHPTQRMPLHHAAESGNGELVRFLVEHGAQTNVADSEGQTPLLVASRHADTTVVETLLSHGAAANAADKEGRTALHHAADRQDVSMVETLLSHGADADRKSREGRTPTSIATANGSEEIVRLLTNRGGRVTIHAAAGMGDLAALERLVKEGANVNRLDVQGQTALHAAANAGQLEAVRWLVEHGAWMDLTDDKDASALSLAYRNAFEMHVNLSRQSNAADLERKYKAVMAYLIGRGAKPEFAYGIPQEQVQAHSKEVADLLIEAGPDMGLCHDSQATLLHRAAWWGKKKVVEDLIELGADIDATDRVGGTPLHAAVQEGCTSYWDVIEGPRVDVMELLLERGAKVDVANKHGRTPLHGAANRGDANAVNLLIEHGANVNAGDAENRTPLDLATGRGHQEVVDLLVSKGAKTVEERLGEEAGRHDERTPTPVSHGERNGTRNLVGRETPLHQAVYKGDIETIKSLIAQGADVNAKDRNNETPLGAAVYRGQKEIVALLLSHGAEVNNAHTGSDLLGCIPLHIAMQFHYTEIAEMLILAGSDVNAQGGYGRMTPLHLAFDNRALFALMLEHGGRIDVAAGGGMTCLHAAAMRGDEEWTRYLLDKGASVNLQDNKGNTPLHWAAKGGHGKVCRVLLDHKAEIRIKNNKGLLPLHYAQASGLDDIVVDLTPKSR